MSVRDAIRRVLGRLRGPSVPPEEVRVLAARTEAMDLGHIELINELRNELRREVARLRSEIDAARTEADVWATERSDAVRVHAEIHSQEVVDLATDRLAARLARMDRSIRQLASAPRSESTEAVPSPTAAPSTQPTAAGADDAIAQPPAYDVFEEQMRGPSALVRQLQAAYVDDVSATPGDGKPVLDVGCGRGEFLSLLAEQSIPAYGVDLNESFASGAAERGLDVRLERGDEHLRQIQPESLRGVTAFHVVEHLPMAAILEFLDLAHRALIPGGVLILETPNPENLAVGANRFWLDPTHLRPLPPLLLGFLVREAGFEDIEVRRLNPLPQAIDPALAHDRATKELIEVVNDALTGPLDYAVIARRT
jgi:O-antigen chain-terminating methyltransferase